MYTVSAQVNDVAVVKVPLLPASFALDVPRIEAALVADPHIKLVYLCSPGNPTGSLVSKAEIASLLAHPTWNGVVVVDEAYVDFAPDGTSLAEWVLEFPNMVVMQTLSKAFGLAGIRLGAAFTSPNIARLLNSLKAPYNVSNPTSQLATAALQPQNLAVMTSNKDKILAQRARLVQTLPTMAGIGKFKGGFDANFLLVEMLDATGTPSNEIALRVYEQLAEKRGVVVRFRGKELWCEGCLRITVGTEEEVDRFLKEIESVLADALRAGNTNGAAADEEAKEQSASNVIA
jgi:histidinol-phosphate aminotransferase